MKKRTIQESILIVAVLALGLSFGVAAQGIEPPQELVQYVRDAKKAGIKEDQIQKNALSAGWPEGMVKAVLQAADASSKDNSGDKSEPSAARTGTDTAGVQASFDVPAGPGAGSPQAGSSPPSTGDAAPGAPTPGPPAREAGKTPAAGTLPGAAKPEPDRGASDDYQIGAGDVLLVSVWKEPDASAAGLVVRNDGKITMPLLRDVVVAGLTLRQAEKLITEQLSKYLTAPPDVVVMATAINSQKIYMIGAVKHEGPMQLTFRMNVLQALSEAGGLTDYAKKKKIYVLRNEGGREFRLPFDYTAVLKGTHMELNIVLRPGDTIVVPH